MPQRVQKALLAIAALTAFAAGGAAIAGAAGSGGTTTTVTTTTPAAPAAPPAGFPPHGTAAHEDAEKPVTGDAATKAKTAAVTAVGGGTAGDVTTDCQGTGYEVTVTKSDGSTVEIHLDSSFAVVQGPPGVGG